MNPIETGRKIAQGIKGGFGYFITEGTLWALKRKTQQVQELKTGRNQHELLNLAGRAERLLTNPNSPAYRIHHPLDTAYRLLFQPEQALRHAGLAVDFHPFKTDEPKSDYNSYVVSYLEAIKFVETYRIKNAPQQLNQAVARLEQIEPKVPSLEYLIENNLGWCLDRLGQPADAFPHHVRSVLVHPTGESDPDFPHYATNISEDARKIIKRAIRNKHQASVSNLTMVYTLTGAVVERYPNLSAIRGEQLIARGHLVRMVGDNKVAALQSAIAVQTQ